MPDELLKFDGMLRCDFDFSNPRNKLVFDELMDQYRFASFFVEGKTILDFPCGDGSGSAILRRLGNALSVVGVDHEGEIEEARAKNQISGIEYRHIGPDSLPETEKFEAVAGINTIKHLSDPKGFIRMLRKHLGPGGELFLSAHVTPTMDFNRYHLCDFTSGSLRRLLRRAGFQIESEFLQVRSFQPGKALSLAKEKRSDESEGIGQRSLLGYYLTHPWKLFTRLKSLLFDGFNVKTLTLRARLISDGRRNHPQL